MKNKKFYTLLTLEIFAVIIVCAYLFLDSTDIYKFLTKNTQFYNQSTQCDLHKTSCNVAIKDKTDMTLSIEPKTIPLMEPLTFKVTTSKELKNDILDLNIYATNMNMGYHSFKMKKIDKNKYQVIGTLPTCVVGGMIWRAEVIIDDFGAAYTFKTK